MVSAVRFGEIYKMMVPPKSYKSLDEEWSKANNAESWMKANSKNVGFYSEDGLARRRRSELDHFNIAEAEQALDVLTSIGMGSDLRGNKKYTAQALEKPFIRVEKPFAPEQAPVPEDHAPGFEAYFVTDGPMTNDLGQYKWARSFQSVLNKAKSAGKPAPPNFQRRAEMFIDQFRARLKSEAMELPTALAYF